MTELPSTEMCSTRARRRWEPFLHMHDTPIDADLDDFSRDQLIAEVRKLREGIRRHRDSSGQELCWHHPALWGLLPEKTDPIPDVPAWPEFLRGCLRYRESLDREIPDAPRTSEEFTPSH